MKFMFLPLVLANYTFFSLSCYGSSLLVYESMHLEAYIPSQYIWLKNNTPELYFTYITDSSTTLVFLGKDAYRQLPPSPYHGQPPSLDADPLNA